MRVATRITTLAAALAFALPFAGADAASLVYRGTLQDGGRPAEGKYDIQLTLYSAATGGKAIAAPVTLYGVPVHDGAFSTEVDFGPAATSAGNVYVAAAVAPQGSSDFVALDARTEASLDAPASTCNGTWALDGNSSNPSGSFLGNVDNQPLVFRVNNGIVGPQNDVPMPLAAAKAWLEQQARAMGSQWLATRAAPWRDRPASSKQLGYCRMKGIQVPHGSSAGEVSDLQAIHQFSTILNRLGAKAAA